MISPNLPAYDYSLVIRTDFSDAAAWAALGRELQAPQTEQNFTARLELFSDPECEGLGLEELAELLPEDPARTFVFIVDTRALTEPEHPILVLDLQSNRSLRVFPPEVWSIENNLRLANMGFEEFLVACDLDGVFRGFSPP